MIAFSVFSGKEDNLASYNQMFAKLISYFQFRVHLISFTGFLKFSVVWVVFLKFWQFSDFPKTSKRKFLLHIWKLLDVLDEQKASLDCSLSFSLSNGNIIGIYLDFYESSSTIVRQKSWVHNLIEKAEVSCPAVCDSGASLRFLSTF